MGENRLLRTEKTKTQRIDWRAIGASLNAKLVDQWGIHIELVEVFDKASILLEDTGQKKE